MMNIFKRVLALCLCVLLTLGCLTACGGGNETPTETTEPKVTESPEEAKVLKVLVLGHSLALDATHLLTLIANKEGYQDLTVGTLYYPGCSLSRHVEYMENNSKEYILFTSSTTAANDIPKQMADVTMLDAIRFDKWDIIVMQGGVFEIGEDETYKDGNIQKIQKFVNENKLHETAIFAWNMAWAPPTDDTLRATYPNEPNTYISNYEKWNDDRTALYNSITKCVSDNILTDDTFQFMIPSGTGMENALSSYLEEKDIHRDYVHATDFARVITSYIWYCRLTGVDKLDAIKLDTVPKRFFKSTVSTEDWVLTEDEKALILESVNNALANPLQMTQSQYTTAPAN